MINILVADDHAVVRAGLKQLVNENGSMRVADEADNGEEALKKALENDFDIILLDITMPGRNGLDIIRELKDKKPQSKILVLTIHPEEQYAMRALRAGAMGYLTKETAPQELISAICRVALGHRYITPSLAEKMVIEVGLKQGELLHQTLSDREFQVMCLIATGKRQNDIGKELSISIKTVSSYRSRIIKKLNLQNNAELIRYVINNRLIQ